MRTGFLKLLVLGLIVFALASSATAATCTSWSLSTPTATSGTNQVLTGSANDPCTDYGLTFSNFSVFIGTGYSGVPFSITATFGSQGTINFSDTEGSGQDIDVEFEVSPGITAILLGMGAGTSINETVCASMIPLPPGTCPNGSVLGTGGVTSLNPNTVIGISPSSQDWVFKDVNGSSTFTQTVTPEPITFVMLSAGLVTLGLLRRKKRQ